MINIGISTTTTTSSSTLTTTTISTTSTTTTTTTTTTTRTYHYMIVLIRIIIILVHLRSGVRAPTVHVKARVFFTPGVPRNGQIDAEILMRSVVAWQEETQKYNNILKLKGRTRLSLFARRRRRFGTCLIVYPYSFFYHGMDKLMPKS